MAESDGDKSQEPTQHRRQQAREQGQVVRSQDLGSAALLVVGAVSLMWMGGEVVTCLGGQTHRYLGGDAWLSTDIGAISAEWRGCMVELAGAVLPIMGTMFVLAIALNVFQVGILFLPDKLAPDLSRIDPLKGFARLFSLASVVRLSLGMLKLVIVGWVAYASIYAERDGILHLSSQELPQIAVFMVQLLLWTTLKIAGALLLLAMLDYSFQWWRQEQDLRMTHQEVREEMKNLQGNPQVIARRRAVQRELVKRRLSTTVPKADVVITNPTELAVAIQYDPQTMKSPVVVAKGAGVLAQRIRRLALENGIPIVEKKPLAQALYKDVDVQQPIPSQMFSAVAEVLAYVYQLKGKKLPA